MRSARTSAAIVVARIRGSHPAIAIERCHRLPGKRRVRLLHRGVAPILGLPLNSVERCADARVIIPPTSAAVRDVMLEGYVFVSNLWSRRWCSSSVPNGHDRLGCEANAPSWVAPFRDWRGREFLMQQRAACSGQSSLAGRTGTRSGWKVQVRWHDCVEAAPRILSVQLLRTCRGYRLTEMRQCILGFRSHVSPDPSSCNAHPPASSCR